MRNQQPEMSVALLIGFGYSQNHRKLPGCVVDLYLFYQYLHKQGFSKILVGTDLTTDPSVEDCQEAILQGTVDSGILSWVSRCRQHLQLVIINSNTQLLELIQENLRGANRFVLYLTGHGHESGLSCPQGVVNWLDLQNHLFSCLKPSSQGWVVLDVCHGYSFQLPFKLSATQERYLFEDTGFFPSAQVVVLTSFSRKAATTSSGSLVTVALIKSLQQMGRRYFYLWRNIEKELSSTPVLRQMNLHLAIYSSHPSLLQIWDWLTVDNPCYSFEEGLFIRLTN